MRVSISLRIAPAITQNMYVQIRFNKDWNAANANIQMSVKIIIIIIKNVAFFRHF